MRGVIVKPGMRGLIVNLKARCAIEVYRHFLMRDLEEKSFLLLLVAVSVAFAWILWPFSGAILWATVLAVVFAPLYRLLLRSSGHRPNIAAVITVVLILLVVVVPLAMIGALVVREAAGLYEKIASGDLELGRFFRHPTEWLPTWAAGLLDHFGLTNLAAIQERVGAEIARASQFLAGQAVSIGQNAADLVVSFFVVLYLLFFLFRDGQVLASRLRHAIPLRPEQRHALLTRFTEVIRATVKGTVVVAAVQGACGGVMFWLLGIQAPALWGAVMAILSLLPAVGAALVWVPVSLYLMVSGALWQGISLMAYGVFVISMVDNFLRPLLVGKETRLPDYLVLISTLGGIAIFGLNGLVLGPVIAALFIASWDIFSTLRTEAQFSRSGDEAESRSYPPSRLPG
jgi:predicted PurR-regulated permease PerM